MPKNIYIINTSKEDIYPLLSFFEELQVKGFDLLFFLHKSKICSLAKEKKLKIKKLPLFLKDSTKSKKIFLTILAPLLGLVLIPSIFYVKKKNRIHTVLCFGSSSKILLRIPLSLLKIKIIWFENELQNKPLRFFSSKVERICFYELNKYDLIKKGIKEEQISILSLGLNTRDSKRQDNIFNNLARENQNKNNISKKESKFFTIGTFADLNSENNLENLFMAIKKALDIIPNIQLIIVGDGKERKKLTWLTQKMKIDTLVWFVGEQKRIGKWLDAFDVFVVSCLQAHLEDFEIVLKSLNSSI
jgi:glycosyltransferase involved in cell wall biosynthesis